MKKIQILGGGCDKCNRLADSVKHTADQLSLDYEIEKVTDINRFAEFGVMITPALVIDGELKVSGKVPAESELVEFLT